MRIPGRTTRATQLDAFAPGRPGLRFGLAAALLALSLISCVGYRPANVPLARVDPTRGYYPSLASQHRDMGDIYLYLALSGGGTRAAAFAYGVFEELRDTEITVDGQRVRLLDQVDVISGVSGGSFPAAYYGLFGDRIFEDFESRFLKQNVQRALIWRALRPRNLLRLMTPFLSRSDLASRYYDEKVFEGATFADLAAVKGPRVYINATDLSHGYGFTFTQSQFDVICSNLDVFPISMAVASSSAVPILLSPITLRNYAGQCGLAAPDWIEDALESRVSDPRRYYAARSASIYMNSDEKPYIHLVDGGISDNLGLRAELEFVAAAGDIKHAREIMGLDLPDHLVVIVVNAERDPNPKIDLSAASPSLISLMNSVSGSQIRRYNVETLLLARATTRRWASDLSQGEEKVTGHLIEVTFDSIEDEAKRKYFKRLPTSFSLTDEQVERLREAGRRLLRQSPGFQDLVRQLQ
jgi:NTE family protein